MSALPNAMPNMLGAPASLGSVQNPGMNVGTAGAPMTQGYSQALQALQNSLQASQNTTSGQMMGLQQQLQQNQGKVQQGLINSGLGQSTVAQTMQGAPLQVYNQGAANVQNQGAERSMGAYNNLASMYAQGGNAMSQYMNPYVQGNMIQGQLANQQSQANQNAAAQSAQNYLYPQGGQQSQQLTQSQIQQLLAAQMAVQGGQQQQPAVNNGMGSAGLVDQNGNPIQ